MLGPRSHTPHREAARRAAFDAFNHGVLLTGLSEPSAALAAYAEVLQSGNADLAPKAAFNSALIYDDDLAAATAAYQIAIDSGHPDIAPKAAVNLGCLLERHGQLADARTALRQAIQSGPEDVAITATLKLERLGRDLAHTRRPTRSRLNKHLPIAPRRAPHHPREQLVALEDRPTVKRSRGHD